MGACAGCAGPIRREQLKNINRLDSPIRDRVTSHQKPLYRQRMTVEQSPSHPLRLSGSINLLNVLTSSPSQPQHQSQLQHSQLQPQLQHSQYQPQPQSDPHQSTALRQIRNSMIREQHRQSPSSERRLQRTFSVEESNLNQFSQYRPTSASTHASSEQLLNEIRANNANLPTFSQHPYPLKKQDDLSTIRQLFEEQCKTPQYVRQKRQQNGEDVIDDGGLELIEIEHMRAAGLEQYLKELI